MRKNSDEAQPTSEADEVPARENVKAVLLDRPIVFGLRIILRKYLTTGSLARAKFEAVSLEI
jgi:hypothetical protein